MDAPDLMSNELQDGLSYLDTGKLESARLRRGLSKTAIADKTGLSRNTVLKAFRGEGIFAESARRISEQLGCDDPNELLARQAGERDSERDDSSGEWEVAEYLGPWVTCSNSLQFRVCKMRHRFLEDRFGRGKCYDLLNPSLRDSERIREHLLRHPKVCARVGSHRTLAQNLSTFPGANGHSWWVIDQWVEGESLETTFQAADWRSENTPRLAWEIAVGLQSLHVAGVIFRELAPRRVIVGVQDGRITLTDFELAKLMDNAPTVSDDWPDDPYRAPEVENGRACVQSDLFSWAKIVLQAWGMGNSTATIESIKSNRGIPKTVIALLESCLAPGPSKRPADIEQVLAVLTRAWPSLPEEHS